MRSFRGKLTLLLIVYFAGFATAIYMLAPVAGHEDDGQSSIIERIRRFEISSVKSEDSGSEDSGEDFNCRMRKCATKVKDITGELTVYLKDKFGTYRYKVAKQTDS